MRDDGYRTAPKDPPAPIRPCLVCKQRHRGPVPWCAEENPEHLPHG